MSIRKIPPEVLRSWPKPNYKNPVTRGNAAGIVIVTTTALTIVAVILRVYTRIWVQRWFGYDDFFVALALIGTIGLSIAVMMAIDIYGWNRHQYDIPPDLFENTAKICFIAKQFFFFATAAMRLSLLSFYYRLVYDAGKEKFRRVLHFTVVLVVAFYIAGSMLNLFLCRPVSAYWQFPGPPNKECFSEGYFGFGISVVNCFVDLLITCLPIPLVLKLNMPIRARFGVLVLFCLGFVVLIASVLRSYFFWVSNVASYDQTWEAYPLWIVTAIEVNVGLICACAPALRVFIKRRCVPAITSLGRSLGGTGSETSNSTPITAAMFFSGDLERGNTQNLSILCRGREYDQDRSIVELDKVGDTNKDVSQSEEPEERVRQQTMTSTIDGGGCSEHGSNHNLVPAPGTAV